MKTWIRAVLGLSFATATTVSASSAHANPWYISAQGIWAQGDNGSTPLANATNNFCYLTRVSGRYAGDGEFVKVYQDGSDEWYIGGASQQQGVSGAANCIPYESFTPEPGGVDNWQNWFSLNTGAEPGGPFYYTAQTTAWQGDAAVMINGITGEFNGGGEYVEVVQAGNGTSFNQFFAGAESPNGVGGWAQTLFVGRPGTGFLPSFTGPNGFPKSANNAGVYTASSGAGRPVGVTLMANVNEAFCYFTEIGGAFGGGGEYAQIVPYPWGSQQFWALEVGSGQANGTFASARCYDMNQGSSLLQ